MLRKVFVYILKNYNTVLLFYNLYYKIINKKSFYNQIYSRKSLSIFDYTELAKPIPYYPIEATRDSNYYGYAYSIKNKCKINKSKALGYSIEHGLYLEPNYVPIATRYKTVKKIITFSEYRKETLESEGINKNIIVVGPYISYVDSLLNAEELDSLKLKIGKVLLVFPMHSTILITVKYNINDFISEVKEFAYNYDTILVCMHYNDILKNQYIHEYVNAGFKITTAGHRFDLNFSSRLKSILLLSDYVYSNFVGTHIGFVNYLRIPQFISINENSFYTLNENEIQIANAFSKKNNFITQEQDDIIKKFWGIDVSKNIKKIINI